MIKRKIIRTIAIFCLGVCFFSCRHEVPTLYPVTNDDLLNNYDEVVDGKRPELTGISILDYKKPWYLDSKCDFDNIQLRPWICVVPVVEIPDEQKGYVIRLPKTYTKTVQGLEFTVNFFQDTYEYNDLIQIRITIKNKTGKDMSSAAYWQNSTMTSRFESTHYRNTRFIYRRVDRGCYTAEVTMFPLMPDGYETSLEYINYADPKVFAPGEKVQYVFQLALAEDIDENPDDIYEVVIPVEVVKAD